ncbi:MAG TPA: DUF3667 domain-containing protein [Flavisolibacter sp.]|nr:DUF3667 domain-containing protein [Flavisolibacter sp.]
MAATLHRCRNCGHTFEGTYCNRCGEKVYTDHDKSVPHLLEEAFHFVTHFEGSFFNTLGAVLTRPGKLSEDYCNGIRKKYFKPISFFLMLVILYLLFPVFQGLNMKLAYHMQHNLYGGYAVRKVTELMQAKQLTEAQAETLFHQKGEKVSKFLLFTILPVMALFSWMMASRKRKLYFDHFIFSVETGSFFILWSFLLLPLLLLLLVLLGLNASLFSDDFIIVAAMAVVALYVARASRRFFGLRLWHRIGYTILYCLALAFFIEYIYKFLLFFIAIHLAG